MAGFLNALSACLVLLMLMAVGYGMGVRGWDDRPGKEVCQQIHHQYRRAL